jgi:hypothetical protein
MQNMSCGSVRRLLRVAASFNNQLGLSQRLYLAPTGLPLLRLSRLNGCDGATSAYREITTVSSSKKRISNSLKAHWGR